MTRKRATIRSITVVCATIALTSSQPGLAGAQLPGVDPGKTVVIVDDTAVQVAVDSPDLTAGTVGVTVQNNTDAEIRCTGIKGRKEGGPSTRAGTVTTTELVARTMSYYAKFPHSFDEVMPVILEGFGVDGTQIFVGTGSVTDLVPGSLMGGLRPEFGEAGRMSELYTAARVNGLVGAIDSVTIPKRSGITLSVRLGHSSTGQRPSDFTPAAVVACERGVQSYLYAGYSGDQTPTIPLGSISSVETGRYGS